jgi:hypothetical protein
MSGHAEIVSQYQSAFGKTGQIASVWRVMLGNIARNSPDSLPDYEFEQLLVRGKDALGSIHYAIRGDWFHNEELKEPKRIWAKAKIVADLIEAPQRDWMERFLFVGQSTMWGDGNNLEDAILAYIGVPEAQTDWLHWLLIDHILFAELIAFQETVVISNENMVPDWSMQMAVISRNRKRAVATVKIFRFFISVIKSLLNPLIYVGLLYLLFRYKSSIAEWLSAPYEFIWVLAGLIGLWYWADLFQALRVGQPTRKSESIKLYGDMERLYRLWTWPMLNPTYFRDELGKVTARGAMYWPSLHILLDQSIGANPVLFRALPPGEL